MPVRSQNSHRMHQTSHGSPPVCGWGKPPPEPAAQSAERSAATIQSISLTQPKRFGNATSFVLALIRMPSVWVSASFVIFHIFNGVYLHEPTVSFGVMALGVVGAALDVVGAALDVVLGVALGAALDRVGAALDAALGVALGAALGVALDAADVALDVAAFIPWRWRASW